MSKVIKALREAVKSLDLAVSLLREGEPRKAQKNPIPWTYRGVKNEDFRSIIRFAMMKRNDRRMKKRDVDALVERTKLSRDVINRIVHKYRRSIR